MVYVKSFLVGIAAALVMLISLPFVGLFIASFLYKAPPGTNNNAISWDLRSLLSVSPISLLFWSCVLIAFLVGSYWEFRRAER